MTALTWWAVALALGVIELVTGTFFVLMLAAAAAATALAVHLGLDSWSGQVTLFSLLAMALCFAWYRHKPRLLKPASNHLNRGSSRWVGRQFVLPDGLAGGEGRVSVDDSFWTVRGPDCAPGTRVRVKAMEGNVLLVEPLSVKEAG